jgi:hypothetical protein
MFSVTERHAIPYLVKFLPAHYFFVRGLMEKWNDDYAGWPIDRMGSGL